MFLRAIVIVMLLACAGSVSAQLSTVRLDRAASQFDIAPGASGRLVFDLVVAAPAHAVVRSLAVPDVAAFAEYTFTPESGTTCAVPVVNPSAERAPIEFVVGPVVAGTTVRCAYRVTRSVASRHDLALGLCELSDFPLCRERLELGTRPDLALSVEPTGTAGVLRLRVANASPRDVRGAIVATECTEFESFIGVSPAPFDVVGDFAGGCPVAPRTAVLCLDFTGTNFGSRDFVVGPIPAGGSASCLVRLVPANGRPVQPGPLDIQLYGDEPSHFGEQFGFTDGGSGFDGSASNNVAALAPQVVGTSVPATGTAALVLLVLVLLVAAARRLALTPT